MSNRIVRISLAVVAAAGSGLSLALPWALYGTVEVAVQRIPGWYGYAITAVALYVCVTWSLVADRTSWIVWSVATTVAGVSTVVWAALLMSRYDHAAALFDGAIPMAAPSLGMGGPVAVMSGLLAVTVPLLRIRATASEPHDAVRLR